MKESYTYYDKKINTTTVIEGVYCTMKTPKQQGHSTNHCPSPLLSVGVQLRDGSLMIKKLSTKIQTFLNEFWDVFFQSFPNFVTWVYPFL